MARPKKVVEEEKAVAPVVEQAPEPKEKKEKLPESVLAKLEAVRKQVDEVKFKVSHRELTLALESLAANLEQAIRWAKNADAVIKAEKLGAEL